MRFNCSVNWDIIDRVHLVHRNDDGLLNMYYFLFFLASLEILYGNQFKCA